MTQKLDALRVGKTLVAEIAADTNVGKNAAVGKLVIEALLTTMLQILLLLEIGLRSKLSVDGEKHLNYGI